MTAALLVAILAGAEDRPLAGPLTTLVPTELPSPGPAVLEAEIVVPVGAPDDLGVGAWLEDHDGTWYQRLHPGRLEPGRQQLRLTFAPTAPVVAEGHAGTWSRLAADLARRGGLFLYSTRGGATVAVEHLAFRPLAAAATAATERLGDLEPGGYDAAAGVARGHTGERWELALTPLPAPANPWDADTFHARATFTHESGATWTCHGFHDQPMRLVDRGDREIAVPAASGRTVIRFRPPLPGSYRLRLVWTSAAGPEHARELPRLVVAGPPRDDVVRVDDADQRFLSIGAAIGQARFFWPIGLNLRSVNDPRGRDRTGSKFTPDRGLHSYKAYLERLAAAGVTTIEVWCSSWNLALEWRDDWPGYGGLGRYSAANAERLDRLLDHAWSLGIRVNLVVRNHGQGSERTDREWEDSPYNATLGGPVARAAGFFTDPRALAAQDRLHRYLVARYGDHPGLLAWKLWSEVNLTGGQREDVRAWHLATAARFQELDPYGHPVTTHWAGDYLKADRAIVALEAIDMVCIDAYHRSGRAIAELLWDSSLDPGRGLAAFAKPILVTEYGGNWNACPPDQLVAEHAVGGWAGLVAGHAGSPMLWWFEWVDQGQRFAPYRALSQFIAGEDLRGAVARPARLDAGPGLWARAWVRPGRLLAYILDAGWGSRGGPAGEHRPRVRIGDRVGAGTIACEWWCPSRGLILARQRVVHGGGRLDLDAPAFRRHLALKMWREEKPLAHSKLAPGSAGGPPAPP